MSILVLRHEVFEHLGHFAEPLADRNPVYHDLGEPIPQGNYNGVVVLGGPMSANDPLPGLKDELAVIDKALTAGAPLLGICLGSQLIAKALGAPVYRNRALEIGWEPVYFTDAGRSDPLFSGMPSPQTFFHWHGETFDLPLGATSLAWSGKTRHQAYRYGSNVYGIQFHPEVTDEMVGQWMAAPVNCGDVAALDGPVNEGAVDQQPLARQIVERWLGLSNGQHTIPGSSSGRVS